MKIIKIILPAAVLLAGLGASASLSFATPEMTKKTKKPCTYCHVKNGAKELNDAGKHYKEKGTLEGYEPKK